LFTELPKNDAAHNGRLLLNTGTRMKFRYNFRAAPFCGGPQRPLGL